MVQRKHLKPLLFFTTQPISTKSKSFIQKELPENVHLLTLDKWNDEDNLLISLENILDKNKDKEVTDNLTVSVHVLT